VIPDEFSFTRYLEAKKRVDDRSLNHNVWEALVSSLPGNSSEQPTKVFETGAGIGTMLARMMERGLLQFGEYTGIDNQIENIQYAHKYLGEWAEKRALRFSKTNTGMLIVGKNTEVKVNLVNADLFEYMESHKAADWDLFVAHAFLDLVPMPDTLSQIINWAQREFLYYFTINYDGLTILEPVIDADYDQRVLCLYDRTMNERTKNGDRYGDHQTGRHLFDHINRAGGSVLSAGSSDWIVYPSSGEYPMDEAYFLHFIINTIYEALRNNPQLDSQQFVKWIDLRHAQIESGELVYMAHQMDYFGTANKLK
jgi:hypothetical protein